MNLKFLFKLLVIVLFLFTGYVSINKSYAAISCTGSHSYTYGTYGCDRVLKKCTGPNPAPDTVSCTSFATDSCSTTNACGYCMKVDNTCAWSNAVGPSGEGDCVQHAGTSPGQGPCGTGDTPRFGTSGCSCSNVANPTATPVGPTATPTPTCPTGQTRCSGVCKNLNTDSSNCGACGNACGTGKSCVNGSCTCSAGLGSCSPNGTQTCHTSSSGQPGYLTCQNGCWEQGLCGTGFHCAATVNGPAGDVSCYADPPNNNCVAGTGSTNQSCGGPAGNSCNGSACCSFTYRCENNQCVSRCNAASPGLCGGGPNECGANPGSNGGTGGNLPCQQCVGSGAGATCQNYTTGAGQSCITNCSACQLQC